MKEFITYFYFLSWTLGGPSLHFDGEKTSMLFFINLRWAIL